jgi:hypothetical protein
MTLWFVFALMTARGDLRRALAVGPRAAAASRRQRGRRLQGSARRDRSRRRRRPDRFLRSGGRARRNQPPPAGGGGRQRDPPARPTRVAPRRRRHGAGRASDRGGCVYLSARLAASRRFSAGRTHPRADANSRSTIWWRRSRRIWRKIRPMAAAGTCWRRCWRGSAATTTRSAPIAIRSPIMATVPSAGPISAKPLPAAAGGVVTAEAKAEFERAIALNADEVKASYFLGLAAEQDGRSAEAAVDLARDAGQGAGRCAVASAGAGRAGAGRRRPRRRCRTMRWPRPRT